MARVDLTTHLREALTEVLVAEAGELREIPAVTRNLTDQLAHIRDGFLLAPPR